MTDDISSKQALFECQGIDMPNKHKHTSCLSGSSSSTSSGSSDTVSTDTESGDENHARGNWSGRLDFFLSCIGYAVGLGNIWRFPYLCYRNGGGAFLVPYLTFLFLCGMPLFFLEVSFGQFSSLSPISAWKVSPLFKGIGYGMVLVSGVVCIYYNIIIAWTLYFLYKSFTSVLPWSTCDNEWNTPRCIVRNRNDSLLVNDSLLINETDETWNTTYTPNVMNMVNGTLGNSTNLTATVASVVGNITNRTTPSEEFWQHHVLQITDGIEDMGKIRWELLVCLGIAWICVFLCLFKGIKSSGKVVYVTATFPYLVLIILLVRGVTLPGAIDGIKYYIIPQFDKLLSFQVWGDAAMQIFYSIGAAWGALITMSSYNKFRNNCYRDALIVPCLNSGTSIFAGFVIFSIIGFMAHETGRDIEDVVTQGPGLIFVVYPAAVARLPVAPVWSILFFVMVFMVGLDTQFGMFETMTSAIIDAFPHLLKKKKALIVAMLCALEMLLGIPCIFQGGIYVLQIMDWYSSTFSLMIISFTELIAICYVYGVNQFYKDISLMIGYQPCIWWKIVWCGITPCIIVFVFLFSIVQHVPVSYGEYAYPQWAVGCGWMLALVSMVPLPISMVFEFLRTPGTFIERAKILIKPEPEWGPALTEHREQYIANLPSDLKNRIRLNISTEESSNSKEKQPFIRTIDLDLNVSTQV
ncbi:sodium- and chloride-dependent glycine transporter 1-like isoform X2 [Lineus longissimus]|uniref:sodium- and chloride-dependent glycine transporter 1-like isoform X2 n=1 Tax=Lineus longissimus TaxID=88925 RepID=UPI00315D9E0A